MAAPGDNLEFLESRYYAAKVAPAPALANEIVEHLKNWPGSGTIVCGGVRQLRFQSRKQTYAVLFLRKNQKVALLNIFEIPEKVGALDEFLEEVRRTFCGRK